MGSVTFEMACIATALCNKEGVHYFVISPIFQLKIIRLMDNCEKKIQKILKLVLYIKTFFYQDLTLQNKATGIGIS